MKYSRTALGLLNAQYRSVLRKCFLINMGLFALGAIATPANAENYTSQQTVDAGKEATYSGDTFTGINGALINSGTVTINNGTIFQDNTTVGGGAAIKNNAGGKITIDNTTFKDNIGTLSSGSYLYGTAIYNAGGELNITNSTFTGNEALKGPQPRAYSSAIFNGTSGGVVSVENTTFTGNYGEYMGGVIQSNGGTTLNLTNTTFDSNNIKDGKSSGASTVLANHATMNIKDTTFSNNYGVDADSSSLDEGIFNAQGAANITFSGKTVFDGNHATAVGVNNYYNPVVTFASGGTNDFTDNQAKNGGAIKNYKPHKGYVGTVTFEEGTTNTFSGNSATVNGGAIYNEQVTNVGGTFTENSAAQNGGAIYNTGNLTVADGTIFEGNKAIIGAGIYNSGTATLGDNITFHNNELTSDTNAHGSAIANVSSNKVTIGDNLKIFNDKEFTTDCCLIYNPVSGTIEIGDNAYFANGADGILSSNDWGSGRATINIGDGATFENMNGAAIVNWYDTDTTIGENANFTNVKTAIMNIQKSTTTVGDNVTITGSSHPNRGAIYNSNDYYITGSDTKVTFEGDATIKDNTTRALLNTTGGDVIFNGETLINNNTFGGNGGAIANIDGKTTDSSKVVFNKAVTISNNTATGLGGAIYNAANGVVDFNGAATFSGNKNGDEQTANDIYNAGTINFNSSADLAGGIDGSAGTVNVSGDVKVANALKNQTVNVANGSELALDKADLSGSNVSVASGALINTIDGVVNNYKENVTLASGSKLKADFGAEAGDAFSAADGSLVTLDGFKLLDAMETGASKSYIVANGANIMTNGKLAEYVGGYKYTATGSSDQSGQVTITNAGNSLINNAVEDTDSNVKTVINYDMVNDESYFAATGDNAKIQKSDFTIEGNDKTLTAASGATGIEIENSDVTINDLTFEGFTQDYALKNNAGSTLRINNSTFDKSNKVAINNAGVLYSDPTTYESEVINSGTASFDEDTFTSTATLSNSGIANLSDVTFKDGSNINGNGGNGTLNFVGGTTVLGATIADNSLNIKNGSTVELTESGVIDGLNLTNDANNGTIDLRNKKIDTLNDATLNSNLTALIDANLNTHEADSFSGTITNNGNNIVVNAIELLALSGKETETINIATAANAGAITVTDDAKATLKTYYDNVDYSNATGILTLSGKAKYASADLVGSWGTKNYIKAYSATDAANTSVGANLTILDEQVKTNEDAISAAETAIGNINDDITVATAGNYIAAGTEVANNLTALDTQVKSNADNIAKRTVTVDATTGIASITDGTNTANVYTKAAAEAIFTEKQKWVDDTLGIKSADADAVKEQYTSTNYLKDATTLTGADKALDTQIKANADAISAEKTRAEGVEAGLNTRLTTAESDIDALETATAITANGHYYDAGDTVATAVKGVDTGLAELNNYVGQTVSTLNNSIVATNNSLNAEIEIRKNAIDKLNGDAETEGSVANSIKTQAAAATYSAETTYADGSIGAAIKANAGAISAETARAQDVEGQLGTAITTLQGDMAANVEALNNTIDAEADRAAKAEKGLGDAINAEQARAQGVEGELSAAITTVQNNLTDNVEALNNTIDAEADRAAKAEKGLGDAINAETARAQDVEGQLSAAITTTRSDMAANVEALNNTIDAEADRAAKAEKGLGDAINAETARAESAEETLDGKIGTVADDLATETNRALVAEGQLSAAITSEKNRAATAEGELATSIANVSTALGTNVGILNNAIDAEKNRATTAEGQLATSIANVSTALGTNVGILNDAITSEKNRATTAEKGLGDAINAETTRAQGVEGQLSAAITNEKTRAEANEAALKTMIENETDRATTAEKGLGDAINAETARAEAAEAELQTAINGKASNERVAAVEERAGALEVRTGALEVRVGADEVKIAANAQAIADVAEDLGDVTKFADSTTKNLSNGGATNATNAADAIMNIDATMGQIHGLASTITDAAGAKNLEQGSTVSGHLVALAGAIGDRSAYGTDGHLTAGQTVAQSLGALDGAIGNLEDGIGDVTKIDITGHAGATIVQAINQLDANFTNGTIDADFNTLSVGKKDAEGNSAFEVKKNGAFTAANGTFKVNNNGKIIIYADDDTEAFTANKKGDIYAAGTLSVADGAFDVDKDGAFTAANGAFDVNKNGAIRAAYDENSGEYNFFVNKNGAIKAAYNEDTGDYNFITDKNGNVTAAGEVSAKTFANANDTFTVDENGAIVAANGGFTVANDGKTVVGNDFAVTDKFKVEGATGNTQIGGDLGVTDKFKVEGSTGNTIIGGTLTAGAGSFTVDTDGNTIAAGKLTAKEFANGSATFTVSDDGRINATELTTTGDATIGGNLNVAGDIVIDGAIDVEGDVNVGDKFSVTAADGSFSAADDKFSVNHNGAITAAGGAFHVWRTGGISASDGNFKVDADGNVKAAGEVEGKTFANANNTFTVDENGAIVAANGGFTVANDGKTVVGNDFAVTDKFTVEGATGNTVVGGNFAVRDKFTVNGESGDTIAAGKLTAKEFANGSATFTVSDDGRINATELTTTGNATVGGDLNVTGTSNLKDTNVDGKLAVSGDTDISGVLAVHGMTYLTNAVVGKDFAVTGTSNLHNTNVDGALAVTGESWLKNTHVDGALAVAGQSYLHDASIDGDMAVSGTTKTTALTFNGESYVAAMDQGDAAITNGTVDDQAKRTMATNATVAKTVGNLAALENTHGVTSVADVASAINSLATNVETATGGTFTNAVWTGKVTVGTTTDYTYGGDTGYNNVMAAVSNIASNIGTATTAANGNITKSKSVNANLDQLDEAIGDRRNLGSANEAINQGTKTSVAAGMRAVGDAIGDMNFTGSHYVAGNNDLSGAVRSLDNNLYRVESDLRDLRRDFRRGMASMSAMSALVPNPRAHGNTSLAIGTGAYDGHTAAAIGGFHYLTDNIMLNAGVAWGNSSDAAYRMGVTFSW